LKNISDEYKLSYIIFSDNNLPSFEETLKIFYNAVLIVGPHGAGLSNMLFSQPGTIVLEIICHNSPIMCYSNLAYNLGMVYHGLVSEPNGIGHCMWMDVNVEALLESVKYLLKNKKLV
jgi:capsular polysaccharide biosynthesis protein